MRLDLFLKKNGIIKRRVIAREMITAGRVHVNGRRVKPAYDVKDGDIIEIFFGNRYLKIQVLQNGFEVLEDEKVQREV